MTTSLKTTLTAILLGTGLGLAPVAATTPAEAAVHVGGGGHGGGHAFHGGGFHGGHAFHGGGFHGSLHPLPHFNGHSYTGTGPQAYGGWHGRHYGYHGWRGGNRYAYRSWGYPYGGYYAEGGYPYCNPLFMIINPRACWW